VKCTVLSALEKQLKFEVGVPYRCTFFVLKRNLYIWCKDAKYSHMRWVVMQCYKINFKSAALATKLRIRLDLQPDCTEYDVLKRGT